MCAHRNLEDGIQPRTCCRIDPKHDRVERYVLELAEHVDAEADDDDGGDVDTACAGLDCLEDDEPHCCDYSRKPRKEVVHRFADKRCN